MSSYTVQIIQTIGKGMSRDTAMKAYRETIAELLNRQPDVPEAATKDLESTGVAFLRARGINVECRREK